MAADGPDSPGIAVQRVEMPRGGGGNHGLGDHFQAAEQSGELAYRIPIPCPPCRESEPTLELTYSSFAGNGVFGLGFGVQLPAIARRTSQNVPRYDDSDVFQLDGVPLTPIPGGRSERAVGELTYAVTAFRPRHESAFERIERWSAGGESFWRVIERDATIVLFGRTDAARVADPADPSRVAEWLVESVIHPHGDVHSYLYQQEDAVGVGTGLSEQGRSQTANRYVDRIRYGNATPYASPDGGITPVPEQSWHFEVVFDYGQCDVRPSNDSPYTPAGQWTARIDPWSSYKYGFERRTHRLCRNVLTFHRFVDELGQEPALVRALELGYDEDPAGTLLTSARVTGYRLFPSQPSGQRYAARSAPPIELTNTPFDPGANTAAVPLVDTAGEPVEGFAKTAGYAVTDLFGDGVPGMLYAGGGLVDYREPVLTGSLASPTHSWTPREPLAGFPVERAPGGPGLRLVDLDGNGALDLVHDLEGVSGFYRADGEGGWQPFAPFTGRLSDPGDPGTTSADLDGDGRADVVWRAGDSVGYAPSLAEDGYGPRQLVPTDPTMPPRLEGDPSQLVTFSDLLGGGTPCLVRVADGSVECWPSIGYGRFGPRVRMDSAPTCAEEFDARRVYLADVDGSGASAIVFAYADRVDVYANLSGNAFAAEPVSVPLPAPWSDAAQIHFDDIGGNGYKSLVFSITDPEPRTWSIDLCGGDKPYLLSGVDNHLGMRSTFAYRSSAWYSLRDKLDGRAWVTTLPFPLQLLSESCTHDSVTGISSVVSYRYHHGHWDHVERELRGFGMVERTEGDTAAPASDPSRVPPSLIKTWFHTGAWQLEPALDLAYQAEYWNGDSSACPSPQPSFDLGDAAADLDTACQARIALSGRMLREEHYGLDGSGSAGIPYRVVEQSWAVRMLQPASPDGYASFLVHEDQSSDSEYERVEHDPLVHQHFVLAVDPWGEATLEATVACARRPGPDHAGGQDDARLIVTERSWNQITDQPDTLLLGWPAEIKTSEVTGMAAPDVLGLYCSAGLAAAQVDAALKGAGPLASPIRWHRYSYRHDGDGGAPITVPALLISRAEALVADADLQTAFAGAPMPGTPADLLEQQGGFRLDDDGYWWDPSDSDSYAGLEGFYQPLSTSDPFVGAGGPRAGAVVEYGYDPHQLMLTSVTSRSLAGDTLPHTVTATGVDYVALAPCQISDENGTVHEAVVEPLGTVAMLSTYGTEWSGGSAQEVGYAPLDFSKPVPLPATLEALVAAPDDYLQGAASYAFEDLDAVADGRGPAATATLTATAYPPGRANAPAGPIQIAVSFHDGARRLVQAGDLAESDPARRADPAPARWRVVERLGLNDRGLDAVRYEPFFAAGPHYVDDATLATQGTPYTTTFYDAIERGVLVETPKGTMPAAFFTEHAYRPWDTTVADADDTVKDSNYWAAIMGDDDAPAWERDALLKAAGAYRTPEVHATDTLGYASDVRRLLTAGDTPLVERRAHNASGDELWAADARLGDAGIHNIERAYTLTGEVLRAVSVDAGTRWSLSDCTGNQIYAGDSRGFSITTSHDGLHRPVAVRVAGGDGAAPLDCTVARHIYGDSLDPTGSPPVDQPATRNLVGREWRHYDSAGLLERASFALGDEPLAETFWIRSLYREEADWRLTGTELDWAHVTAALDAALDADPQPRSIVYDGLGRIVQEVDAAGNTTAPTYLVSGLVDTLAWTPAGGSERAYVTGTQYDAAGQPLHVGLGAPDGGSVVATDYAYDPGTARATRIATSRVADGTALQSANWYWDPVGNPTHVEYEVVPGPTGVAADADFTFDALYRLAAAGGRALAGYAAADEREPGYTPFFDGPGEPAAERYTAAYQYDRGNNLTQLGYDGGTRWSRQLVVSPGSNRAVLSPGSEGPDPTAGRFDAGGNQTVIDGIDAIGWNSSNDVQRVAVGDRTEYVLYDSYGRRRAETIESGAVVERTVYLDGGLERYRRTTDGTVDLEVDRVRIAPRLDTVAVHLDWTKGSPPDGAATAWFQISDLIDSAVLELSDAGEVAHFEGYLPFGGTALAWSEAGEADMALKTRRFGGHERAGASGLYSIGARWYAPWLGRWASPDPGLDIDGLNLYGYAGDNPVTFVDHSGFGKRTKFDVSVRDYGDQTYSFKVSGRPKKFAKTTLTSLHVRFKSEHTSKTRLKAGRSRNHVFPWLGISKEVRTQTRRQPLAKLASYLLSHTFQNTTFGNRFAKLAQKGLKTALAISAAAKLVLLDRYNDPDNLYIGNSSVNSSEGSKMKHRQQALSQNYKGAASARFSAAELNKKQDEMRLASLDAPAHYTPAHLAALAIRYQRAWKTRRVGKYM